MLVEIAERAMAHIGGKEVQIGGGFGCVQIYTPTGLITPICQLESHWPFQLRLPAIASP
jgi:hypothetical protein